MSDTQKGKRERSSPGRLRSWWAGYRAWTAGLDKKARLRYRACQALAVTAVLAVAAALFLRAWIRLPEVPEPPVSSSSGPVSGSSSSQSEPAGMYEGAELPEVVFSGRKEGVYTFLVAGQDQVSGATDTILLFTYDTKNQKISAISLLRDTMINTTAASKRLNAVYYRSMGERSLPEKERVANGMAALRQEVSKLTGIYADFYVLVQWEAIGELVDAIGGVEFEVPFDMNYDDSTPGQNLHIHQKAGLRVLSGQDAMEVIRFRKNNDDSVVLYDTGRTQIQRDFLTAVIKECLQPDILLKLPALAQVFLDNVTTDLTVGNILAFAQLAVGMDTETDVNFVTMPFDNAWYNGASMVVARQEELLELLNDGLNPYLSAIQASDLQLIYAKSGGGYGVTNANLADPAMGRAAPVPSSSGTADQPAGPGGTDSGGANSGGTNSGGTNSGGTNSGGTNSGEEEPGGQTGSAPSGEEEEPGGQTGSAPSGEEEDPGGQTGDSASPSGEVPVTINPADIFPNFPQNAQTGEEAGQSNPAA